MIAAYKKGYEMDLKVGREWKTNLLKMRCAVTKKSSIGCETPKHLLIKKKSVSATVSRIDTGCKRLVNGSYTRKTNLYMEGVKHD
jgi:hypothetical protein